MAGLHLGGLVHEYQFDVVVREFVHHHVQTM